MVLIIGTFASTTFAQNFTNATSDVIITYYNTQGELLNQFTAIEPTGVIDISRFPSGIYLLKVNDTGSSLSKFLQLIK